MAHDVNLGELIDAGQQRDAIHIAIAPVIAAEKLSPGQDIGFVGDDRERVGASSQPIGIVDPFLKRMVYPEQRFFMFLFPQTVTGMRHHWEHPAFGPPVDNVALRIEVSTRWIKDFAVRINQTYQSLMAAAEQWVEHSDWTYDNSETYKDYYEEFDEFWKHYEIVTGKAVEDKSVPFTCSC